MGLPNLKDPRLNATSEGRQRIADAAIDYPGTWVVIEVTTSQLRRELSPERSCYLCSKSSPPP
jgi:hypothetical protein